jgi:hypothetical protein
MSWWLTEPPTQVVNLHILVIVPYSNPILEKRGVKIGRNPFDNSVIITPYSGPDNSFPYPVGFWIRVVSADSIY